MTEKKTKIEVLTSENKEDETMCTFVLHGEDHTLGNPLRYIILKNPAVEFCGYSIPHPSEHKIHLRIQTYPSSNVTAVDALKRGLVDLSSVCSHILTTFTNEVEHYKDTHPDSAEEELANDR